MALVDINFSEGERQEMLLEIDQGTLNDPQDILVEASAGFPVEEITSTGGTTRKIVIMTD